MPSSVQPEKGSRANGTKIPEDVTDKTPNDNLHRLKMKESLVEEDYQTCHHAATVASIEATDLKIEERVISTSTSGDEEF